MMNPTVCLLVGDTHTKHCGVKDYALKLAQELEQCGVVAEVVAPPSWRTKEFLPFCKVLRQRKFDICHLQYPSIGHRASLWPHMMGRLNVAAKFVVTLHEYSALYRRHQLSTRLFSWTTDQLLFTTDTEMQEYGRSRVGQKTIFIGSNVPPFPGVRERGGNVLYFGQIRSNKGIEEFLKLAEVSQKSGLPFTFQVIGSVPERQADNYRKLRAEAAAEVEWTIDPSFDEVARIMAGSLAAYLPFPDGATYRRGSLLAALTNGLPVLTRVGPGTPADLAAITLPTAGVEDALDHLRHLRNRPEEARNLSSASRRFSERFAWPRIAQMHKQIYNEVLQPGIPVGQPFVTGAES